MPNLVDDRIEQLINDMETNIVSVPVGELYDEDAEKAYWKKEALDYISKHIMPAGDRFDWCVCFGYNDEYLEINCTSLYIKKCFRKYYDQISWCSVYAFKFGDPAGVWFYDNQTGWQYFMDMLLEELVGFRDLEDEIRVKKGFVEISDDDLPF